MPPARRQKLVHVETLATGDPPGLNLIARLPDEILGMIFETGYYDVSLPSVTRIAVSYASRVNFALKVALADHRWRKVALSYAVLWSSISYVDAPSQEQWHETKDVALIPMLLQRSKRVSLDIVFSCEEMHGLDVQVWRLLAAHLSRCRSLTVDLPYAEEGWADSSVLLSKARRVFPLQGPLSRLEDLTVHMGAPKRCFPNILKLLDDPCTPLRRLRLSHDGCSFKLASLPIDRIEFLRITYDGSELTDTFVNSLPPSAVRQLWFDPIPEDSLPPDLSSLITHSQNPSLRSFTVTDSDLHLYESISPNAALEELRIICTERITHGPAISQTIWPNLRHLIILEPRRSRTDTANTFMRDDIFRSFAAHHRSIEHLAFESCELRYYYHLVEAVRTGRKLWKNLRSIDVQDLTLSIDAKKVAKRMRKAGSGLDITVTPRPFAQSSRMPGGYF